MKMINQIGNVAGAVNQVTFLGVSAAKFAKIVDFAQDWTIIMFALSGTLAVVYSTLKIVTWFKNNKKIKK